MLKWKYAFISALKFYISYSVVVFVLNLILLTSLGEAPVGFMGFIAIVLLAHYFSLRYFNHTNVELSLRAGFMLGLVFCGLTLLGDWLMYSGDKFEAMKDLRFWLAIIITVSATTLTAHFLANKNFS